MGRIVYLEGRSSLKTNLLSKIIRTGGQVLMKQIFWGLVICILAHEFAQKISLISAKNVSHGIVNRCPSNIFKGLTDGEASLKEHPYTCRSLSEFLSNLPPSVATDINVRLFYFFFLC